MGLMGRRQEQIYGELFPLQVAGSLPQTIEYVKHLGIRKGKFCFTRFAEKILQ